MHRTPQHRLHGIAVVLTLLASLFVASALTACSLGTDPWDDSWYESDPYYDWNGFSQVDGRISYTNDESTFARTGVDVSDHQGTIDWDAVAGDGIEFAFVRIGYRGNTEGLLHADAQFEQNLSGAQAAGIACGTYFYSQALSAEEARDEALFTLALLGSRELEYPVVFDYEPNDGNRLSGIDGATATACARAFCDVIEEAGYEVMLYGNYYDLQYLDLSELGECGIWFAEYASAPSSSDAFAIWQYTASGQVRGIETPADLNLDLSEAL